MLPRHYIAFDLETTDQHVNSTFIMEIALVEYDNGNVVDKFVQLVCPPVKPSPGAMRITQIPLDELVKAPQIEDVLPEVQGWFDSIHEDTPLVTFNGDRFDLPVMKRMFKHYGYDWNDPVAHIDCFKLAKEKIPGLPSYKQDAVLEACHPGYKGRPAHRAENDCRNLAAIYEHLRIREHQPTNQLAEAVSKTESPLVRAALLDLGGNIQKIQQWCELAPGLPCETDEQYNKTVDATIALKNLRKQLEATRKGHTDSLLKPKQEIESFYREFAIKPLTAAINAIAANQQQYLDGLARKQRAAEEAARQRSIEIAEAERKRQIEAGVDAQEAADTAEIIQSEVEQDLRPEPVKTKTALGSATIVTTYKCEIIDAKAVPKHLWSPDIKLIERTAKATQGAPIPGVAITPVRKTRTTSKRSK